jgi:hypothetical protein
MENLSISIPHFRISVRIYCMPHLVWVGSEDGSDCWTGMQIEESAFVCFDQSNFLGGGWLKKKQKTQIS